MSAQEVENREKKQIVQINVQLYRAEDGGNILIQGRSVHANTQTVKNTTSLEEAKKELEALIELLFEERGRQLTRLRDELVNKLGKAQGALTGGA